MVATGRIGWEWPKTGSRRAVLIKSWPEDKLRQFAVLSTLPRALILKGLGMAHKSKLRRTSRVQGTT